MAGPSRLGYRSRRRWSLVILLIGLPLYIVIAVSVVDWLGRPSPWVAIPVYVALGLLWIAPFRFVFLGVGQPDPGTGEAAMPVGTSTEDPPASD